MCAASVKSLGFGSYILACEPSPFPPSPWHSAHLSSNNRRAPGKSACDAFSGFATRFASSGTIHGPGCKNAYTADPAATSSSTTNNTNMSGDFLREGLVIGAKTILALQESQSKLLRKIFMECGSPAPAVEASAPPTPRQRQPGSRTP